MKCSAGSPAPTAKKAFASNLRPPPGFPGALQHVWTLATTDARKQIEAATHVVWTTGGSMVPEEQYQAMLQRGIGLTRLD